MKKVSVVIPAYNAEKLMIKAVESALQFKEVDEVLLVEDGSSDNTLNICKQLGYEYHKVKVYHHLNGINKGAGASRNLGIKKAANEYIAFLDADDYFLPNRFDAEKKIFCDDAKVDGVYGAVGVHYYSDSAKEKYKKKYNYELTTLNKRISPKDLKYTLLGISKNYNGSGFFHLDSLTVRKKLLEEIGYFNEELRLHQDSDLIIKLAFLGRLVPGIIDTPICMRGVHDNNRITSAAFGFDSRYLFFSELEQWLDLNIIGEEKAKRCARKNRLVYRLLKKRNKFSQILHLTRLFLDEPYLFYIEWEFNRLIKGVFGNSLPVKVSVRLKKMIFHVISKKRINRWNDYLYL